MTDETDAPKPASLSDAEIAGVYSIPAALANRIVATNFPNGMRLSFAEHGVGRPEPDFRAAVFLSYDDAAAMADLIMRQLALFYGIDSSTSEAKDNGPSNK